MSDDLKPCPFCACDQLKISPNIHTGLLRVQCEGCWATSVTSNNRANLIAAWNRRASDAEIERLRAALTECSAPYDSGPTTVLDGARLVAAEFQRRMDIAGSALSPLPAQKDGVEITFDADGQGRVT